MKFVAAPILVFFAFVFGGAIAVADEKAPADEPERESKAPEAEEQPEPAPIPRTGPDERFPVRIDVGDRKLQINGWGLCEWGIFGVDLYYCALHAETTSQDAAALLKKDQAYNIHLDFVRDLTRKQMKKAYSTSVEVNAGKNLPRYRERLNKLLSFMPAVSEGDDLHFRYVPGSGMTMRLNDKLLGTIEGADWARLFLGLYIGSNPPTKDLRRGLLGS